MPLTGKAGADIYGVKGIPVTTNDAPFEEEGRRHRRHARRRSGPADRPDPAVETLIGSDAEEDPGRPPGRIPTDPEHAMCTSAVSVVAETFPFHHRHPMTTVKLQKVAELGAASLYCDCLHEGHHEWPPTLQPILSAASTHDRVEEGEVLG